MKKFINYNGKIFDKQFPVLQADNRGYRFGESIFETMKMLNGKISLADFHFERLMGSLQIMKIKMPKLISAAFLKKEIEELCEKNGCSDLARIRLSISGGNGGLNDSDNNFQYLVECWPLENSFLELNENGLIADIFPDARKSTDKFANLKSANYLPYVMAAKWAKENKLNDAFVLNSFDRICDSTIANIFCIRDTTVFTPPLSEGCIAGVMRKYLLETLFFSGFKIKEQILEIADIETAEEVFLSNAIRGIRWVKQFRKKEYSNLITAEIYQKLLRSY